VTRLKKFPAELVKLVAMFDDSPSDFLTFWSFVMDVVAIMAVGAVVVPEDAEDSRGFDEET
jgi:hypothetical protein